MSSDNEWVEEEPDETTFARGRLANRTYASKGFNLKRPGSSDDGALARFAYKVFDPETESALVQEGEEWVLKETPAGRFQIKVMLVREQGNLKELWIQRVPGVSHAGEVKNLLNLKQPELSVLVEFLKVLESVSVEGGTSVRVDDSLVQDLFADPKSLATLYGRDPERFRRLIADDAAAKDVVALAARRARVDEFRRLLNDDAHFDSAVAASSGAGPEAVWQSFFEANPWILGVTLASQLLMSWDDEKLERIVVGSSISGVGKRADALLRTAGRIRSMVFAEIKTHQTKLLGPEYRSGCWRVSAELSGGVAQVQGTVHRAIHDVGERIADIEPDGSERPGEYTYLLKPRSLLIVGRLDELKGISGGDHQDKIRSFELYRRNLAEPEVVTFDELLARAEWFVEPVDEF
jgi:Domain of unknown function (DUF4263)